MSILISHSSLSHLLIFIQFNFFSLLFFFLSSFFSYVFFLDKFIMWPYTAWKLLIYPRSELELCKYLFKIIIANTNIYNINWTKKGKSIPPAKFNRLIYIFWSSIKTLLQSEANAIPRVFICVWCSFSIVK